MTSVTSGNLGQEALRCLATPCYPGAYGLDAPLRIEGALPAILPA
jgi:hypothetical protein